MSIAAGMSRSGVITILMAVLFLEACSGGGGNDVQIQPTLPWGRLRGGAANTGRAIGGLAANPGDLRFSTALPGGTTISSPAVGFDGTVYVGSGSGLVAIASDGSTVRSVEGYRFTSSGACEICAPAEAGCTAVGPVAGSPALSIDDDIVVGTESGQVLGLRDDGNQLHCDWVYSSPGDAEIRSSPLVLTSSVDRSLTSIVLGTGTGHLQALNGDGSEKWRFAPASLTGPLTSSPGISVTGEIYFTAPDGFLYALDLAGRLLWRAEVGAPPADALLPSPAVSVAVYAVGADGLVSALHAAGNLKWRFRADSTISSSPALTAQTVTVRSERTPTPQPTPDATQESTPTATPTVSTSDVVIYVVDDAGTLYGIRDSTGALEGRLQLTGSAPVGSPAVSSDLFVIIGDESGILSGATLDGTPPCVECEDSRWQAGPDGLGGQLSLGSEILSSPVIAEDGTIYLTTADGRLHAIGSPLASEPTETPTPTGSPTPSSTPVGAPE